MSLELEQARPSDLDEVLRSLSAWQHDGAPVQLHPGDLGWHWRSGARSVAAAVRVWRRDREIVAIGFADGASLIRMGIAPDCDEDGELAARILDDLSDPARRVLSAGAAAVEARSGTALRTLLTEQGWVADEPWVPLRRDVSGPVEFTGLRIELVGTDTAADWLDVVRVAFGSAAPPPDRWSTLAGSPMLQEQLGRCLIGYDEQDRAAAAVAVWSAGPGRPGLIEPMGVHEDHRGRGHGRAITLAAVAELRSMGSSGVVLATPDERAPAVATYLAAGFRTDGAVTDFRRTG